MNTKTVEENGRRVTYGKVGTQWFATLGLVSQQVTQRFDSELEANAWAIAVVNAAPGQVWAIAEERRAGALYPVLCAWCLKLGRRTVIEYTTVSDSHGICEECSVKALAEVGL